ncbi:14538_t:CDS:2 [Ambispora leptoticha]|uniref:14538_t:CDS:1 n=1 Tax=Ambispora leptoticha TaxID=144679 RepID=A0A9N8VDX2_9GLOM|nr:14538_t:CDS:2 [Ambispora leptoticha]
MSMSWVWVCSLPLTFLNSPRVSDPSIGGHDVNFGTGSDVFGVIFFVTGLLVETVADWSKASFLQFRLRRSSPLEFITTGLWGWSRHPNYFGEILPTASGIGTNIPWLSILSPIYITSNYLLVLLLFVSGLPFTEIPTQKKQYTLGYENPYFVYREQTSILIPIPPVLYGKFPDWVKRTILLDFLLYKYHPKQKPGVITPQV